MSACGTRYCQGKKPPTLWPHKKIPIRNDSKAIPFHHNEAMVHPRAMCRAHRKALCPWHLMMRCGEPLQIVHVDLRLLGSWSAARRAAISSPFPARHLRKLGTVARRLHRHIRTVEPGSRTHHCQAIWRYPLRKCLVYADRNSTQPSWAIGQPRVHPLLGRID